MHVSRIPLSDLASTLAPRFDAFICCASFEERSLSVARSLNGAQPSRALIVANTQEHERKFVSNGSESLRDIFGDRASFVDVDSSQPLLTADNLKAALDTVRGADGQHFLVDFTTFTHETLLILFKILEDFRREEETHHFVYTGAAEYSVGDEPAEKWLSKGCKQVRSVLGYPGDLVPLKNLHLIVLVGFEHERATSLVAEYEPDVLSLGYGAQAESVSSEHQQANVHFCNMVERLAPRYGTVDTFEFSCVDPQNCCQKIRQRIAEVPEHNVVVAPMNTKISTLGAALAAREDRAIQLCYAQAELYNYDNYSAPDDYCYCFEL